MTYTVLARDRRAGLIGAATASKSLAVGNAVLALRPGVGVVASQAWTNRALRGRLLDALEAGASAADAVASVPDWDDRSDLRQVALLPVDGPGAAFSGRGTTVWSGDLVELDVIVAGNVLTGGDVLAAMMAVMQSRSPIEVDSPDASARFGALLAASLRAGQERGGDARGRQSAAVIVATTGHDADVRVDLRVDDHADPLAELDRLIDLRGDDLRDRVSARTV